jgi:hypothetical protein
MNDRRADAGCRDHGTMDPVGCRYDDGSGWSCECEDETPPPPDYPLDLDIHPPVPLPLYEWRCFGPRGFCSHGVAREPGARLEVICVGPLETH